MQVESYPLRGRLFLLAPVRRWVKTLVGAMFFCRIWRNVDVHLLLDGREGWEVRAPVDRRRGCIVRLICGGVAAVGASGRKS